MHSNEKIYRYIHNYERYSMKKEVQYTKYIGKKLLIANG